MTTSHINVLYLRDGLSPRDHQDLEDYLSLLRRYFDVPDDEPVFPAPQPTGRNRETSRTTRPATHGGRNRNAAGHPWRAATKRAAP